MLVLLGELSPGLQGLVRLLLVLLILLVSGDLRLLVIVLAALLLLGLLSLREGGRATANISVLLAQ